MSENPGPTIRDLYPNLTDAEFAEAEDNLDLYLALVLRIFERVRSESHPQAGQLTPGTGTLPCTPPKPEFS
jgi:hypothetical protein